MKHTAKSLAMRDRALAAAMGVIGGNGSGFGYESKSKHRSGDFGVSFGVDFGGDDDADEMSSWGADAAPAAAAALANPQHPASPFHPANRSATMKMWNQQQQGATRTQKRHVLLEPNHGSSVKVERYTFAVGTQTCTLGTATAIALTKSPAVNFRPQRFVTNAPAAGFVTLTQIQVANVNAIVGGSEDAYFFNPQSVGITLSLPTLTPSNSATVSGSSTTYTPANYNQNQAFPFIASFTGWATIVA